MLESQEEDQQKWDWVDLMSHVILSYFPWPWTTLAWKNHTVHVIIRKDDSELSGGSCFLAKMFVWLC